MRTLLLLLLSYNLTAQTVCPLPDFIPNAPSTNRVLSETPILHSLPSATRVLLIDFDGQVVQSPYWASGAIINAEPSNLTVDGKIEVFNRVKEDYYVWQVDVTTDSVKYNNTPLGMRQRIIVTPTHQWYTASVGGVAYVGTFSVNEEVVGWTFEGRLGGFPKFVAESVSHEAGHTLGLRHQAEWVNGVFVQTYNPGIGPESSPVSWAPIMGNSYYKKQTLWHNGQTPFGDLQDDMAVIGSVLPLKPKSTTLERVIHNLQIDSFPITVTSSSAVRVLAFSGGNTDITLELNGVSANAVQDLHDTLVVNIPAGTHILKIHGTDGPYTPSAYGSAGQVDLTIQNLTLVPLDTTRTSTRRPVKPFISYDENYIHLKTNKSYFYTLINISGQPVKQAPYKAGVTDIHIGNLPRGIYILITEFSKDKIIKL